MLPGQKPSLPIGRVGHPTPFSLSPATVEIITYYVFTCSFHVISLWFDTTTPKALNIEQPQPVWEAPPQEVGNHPSKPFPMFRKFRHRPDLQGGFVGESIDISHVRFLPGNFRVEVMLEFLHTSWLERWNDTNPVVNAWKKWALGNEILNQNDWNQIMIISVSAKA